MNHPQQAKLPCGCAGAWNDDLKQYVADHSCVEAAVLRAKRLTVKRRMAEESARMLRAQLNGDRTFRLLK